MIVRPARGTARPTAAQQPSYQAWSFPGPSNGWVADQNLALGQPGSAYRLDNIFPTPAGGILRRGCTLHSSVASSRIATKLTGTVEIEEESTTVEGTDTEFESELSEGDSIRIGDVEYTVASITSDTQLELEEEAQDTASGLDAYKLTDSAGGMVKTLFSYQSGSTNQLFAITDEQIWDVSLQGEATSLYPVTEGRWSVAQYTNTDGVRWVRGVNGVDTPWLYDGEEFTTSPALTFDGGDDTLPEDLNFVWVFKNRFFFIKKDSLDAYYLAVGTLGGELAKFSLGGVFPKGGTLVYGGTWSQETGDGLSAMCVFVTDNGEVAVFQGDNPGEAESWSKVGVYSIGKPMGPNAVIQRGGDIAFCSDVGLISLSQALLRDAEALSPTSMSKVIGPEWNRYVAERQTKTWQATAWTEGQMLAIALPTASGQQPIWLVQNAETGRWARFTGWDASCLATFGGGLFYGSPDGNVYQANVGGLDNGLPFVGVYIPSFSQMDKMGAKTVHMARATIRSRLPVGERLSVQKDYRIELPAAPDAAPIAEASVWGIARWGDGVSRWGGSSESNTITQRWRNVFGEGEALTIAHQVTSASVAPIDAEFIRTDVLFTAGEVQA